MKSMKHSSGKEVKSKNGEVLYKEYPPGTRLSVIMADHAFLWGGNEARKVDDRAGGGTLGLDIK